MKKFLFPLFLSFIMIVSPILVSTSFVTTAEAQLLPNCPSLARSPSPCLNADGSTRPPNTYGSCPVGAIIETCLNSLGEIVSPGGQGAIINCTPSTPESVACLMPDGSTRPATTPTGGAGEFRNETNEKICEQIRLQPGGIAKELRNGIVPCGRSVDQCAEAPRGNEQCEFKHLFILVNKLVSNFITRVFAPLVVIVLTYIGFLFIKDKAAAKTKAKELLMKVLIGTFFVLAAWLIVNFVLKALDANTIFTTFFGAN